AAGQLRARRRGGRGGAPPGPGVGSPRRRGARRLRRGAAAGPAGGGASAEAPRRDLRRVRHPQVVATPHLGAQTAEAQERTSTETAQMVLEALAGSFAGHAVNLPFSPSGSRGEPFLRLAEQLGRLSSALLRSPLKRVQVDLWGIDEGLQLPVTLAVLKGVLEPFLGAAVNYVNVERIALGRGIETVRAAHGEPGEYPYLISVSLHGSDPGTEGRIELAGTLFGDHQPRGG